MQSYSKSDIEAYLEHFSRHDTGTQRVTHPRFCASQIRRFVRWQALKERQHGGRRHKIIITRMQSRTPSAGESKEFLCPTCPGSVSTGTTDYYSVLRLRLGLLELVLLLVAEGLLQALNATPGPGTRSRKPRYPRTRVLLLGTGYPGYPGTRVQTDWVTLQSHQQ
eukprot:1526866-Rhodomonas_salina.2